MRSHVWSLVAALLAIPFAVGESATIRIPADQPTIQAGVNAAAYGDTVLVAPGFYVENVVMKNGIALIGSRTDMPVIHSANGRTVVDCQLGVFGSETRIEGFCLEGALDVEGTSGWLCGVRCDDSSATIRYNVIRDNWRGVVLKESRGHAVIDHNTIVGNRETGIMLYNGSDLAPSGTSSIRNNIVVGTYHDGVQLSAGGDVLPLPLAPDLDYNDVYGNGELWNGHDYFGVVPGQHDVSFDPVFCELGAGNYLLDAQSPCLGAGEGGTTIGALDIGCGPSEVTPATWGQIKALYR